MKNEKNLLHQVQGRGLLLAVVVVRHPQWCQWGRRWG